ncbi:EamA family transporter [Hominifimenecus sp. rT4P-3]|uniref:EamA family transporter n=1 Tax=Hominifimenecus sp. rT4P-3 TaxID=3242979 RepID=UPI003DA42FA2
MNQKKTIKNIICLHGLLFLYSFGGIFSKLAAREAFLSWKFILFYGVVLANLFIYALLWQQILKRLPLVTAYANKAVTIVWGIIWGRIFFAENITGFNILGSIIIIAGIYIVVSEKGNK